MKYTTHAKQRSRQRGFLNIDSTLKVMLEFGRIERAPGGADRIIFGRKEHQCAVGAYKHAIQLLDHLKGANIITSDGKVLTVYKK